MVLHIIKLCVGITSVEQLVAHRAASCVRVKGHDGPVHVHVTRMMPRRAAEIEGAGSLYWVINGAIRCRQRIIQLARASDSEGKPCCHIIMAPDLVRTVPRVKRPFQGWRYLTSGDAPGDLEVGDNSQNSAELADELAHLGLI
ncbi:hypothetical protein MNBD_ALPHA12-998 [hydrothermal vent metagenome]|uniref:Lysophospholipase n=1 Tax=hydrothermal vent metagenome TaxID=652676 RepID=A0A3B0THD0_9ZZZZ